MGRMLTHKNLIVRLHLQGRTVLEIARQTYHNPRSVAAYLRTGTGPYQPYVSVRLWQSAQRTSQFERLSEPPAFGDTLW